MSISNTITTKVNPPNNYYFECNLHIAIIHFDEIIGPKLLQIYPEIKKDIESEIKGVLQQLIDLGSYRGKDEWEFMYSDNSFSSINMYLSLKNTLARGSNSDFMISLIIFPTYPQVISAMALDWNSLYELKTKCVGLLSERMISSDRKIIEVPLEFILGMSYDIIKENISFNLEIIAPDSFKL